MVKIRLKRMGTTKRPVYRLVVADSRSPRDGRFIESIGFYDPLPNPAVVRIDAERVQLWLKRGARPSDSARQLLVKEGLLAARPFTVTVRVEAPEPAKAKTNGAGAKAAARAAAADVAPTELESEAAEADDTAVDAASESAAAAEVSDGEPASDATAEPAVDEPSAEGEVAAEAAEPAE